MTGMQRGKKDYSTQVSEEVQATVRATVRGIKMKVDPAFTMAALTEEALLRYCKELEKLHNDGRPWPADNSRLPPGRIVQP